MNLTFCDLCNESIPQADLDEGRAVRRNERWICAACEAAMSSSRPASLPPVRPLPAPAAPAGSASSAVMAVALGFSGVALLAAAGSAAFLFVQLDRTRDALEQRIASGERGAFERERTLLASLDGGAAERESERERAREELLGLDARVQELEQEGGSARSLVRRVEALEERPTNGDASLDALELQAEELRELRAAVQRLQDERRGAPERSAPPEESREPSPSIAETPPAAPGESAPTWQGWLADLASQDSGTRWQAVQSLGGTHDAAVVPHLLPVLEDSDIFVRMATARILGDLGAPSAIPALIDALEDEEASVREAVLVSLRGLSGQSIPFDPLAREPDRQKRVKAWREWWEQAAKQLLGEDKKARG